MDENWSDSFAILRSLSDALLMQVHYRRLLLIQYYLQAIPGSKTKVNSGLMAAPKERFIVCTLAISGHFRLSLSGSAPCCQILLCFYWLKGPVCNIHKMLVNNDACGC